MRVWIARGSEFKNRYDMFEHKPKVYKYVCGDDTTSGTFQDIELDSDKHVLGEDQVWIPQGLSDGIKSCFVNDEDLEPGQCRAFELIPADEYDALLDKVRKLEVERNILHNAVEEPLTYSIE